MLLPQLRCCPHAESWQHPPPPPAYGAPLPPFGIGHAQASYYHQQLVPDVQLLGQHASSPWGLQAPWETEAYGFLSEVCGMEAGCGSGSGFGSGSGHGSAPSGVSCIDLCSSLDESVVDLVSSLGTSSEDLNGLYFDLRGPGPGVPGSIPRQTFDTSSESGSSSNDPDDFWLDTPCMPTPLLNLFHLLYCMLLPLPYEAAVQFEHHCVQYRCAPHLCWGGALTLGLSCLQVVSMVLPSGCSAWLIMHL